MAKKKQEKALNIDDILFKCRDILRKAANSGSNSDKRDFILTLVFLRFIGEKYEDGIEHLRQQLREQGFDPDDENIRIAFFDDSTFTDGTYNLPVEARWSTIINTPATKLNVALDEADLIGYEYEYFLKEFAVNATKEDGEFYTPHDAVQLIANMIEPYNGTLYDPCCGSGGMFIQSADIVKAKRGDISGINVYGQEKEGATYRLAKMNLALRGISHHLGDVSDSTFTNDLHRGIYFNYIMANPPFNLKNWYDDNLKNDARWADYTTPPASNANYAWILHILSHMKPLNGVAGFLLANGALAIIVLPRELFIIISNLYNVENSHGIRYVLAA